MTTVLIDNYDSFTYNLYQYLAELGADVRVFRNDQVTMAEIRALNPDHVVISPGPGNPDDAGISRDVIREYAGKVPSTMSTAARWQARARSSTARPPTSTMTAGASSKTSRMTTRPSATTRSPGHRRPSHVNSKSPQRPRAASSWASATGI